MIAFQGSPTLLKGRLLLIDPVRTVPKRIIILQYNPDTLTRTLQVQGVGPEGGDRSEALRLKAPPIEIIKLEAEIDFTDQMENIPLTEDKKTIPNTGLHPELAALETLIYPPSDQLIANNELAKAGTLEIAPVIAPLTLFVWSESRVLPVRIIELGITEEAFDPNLNPIRVKVSLGMRVLTVYDLGFDARSGGDLYLTYQQKKELFAAQATARTFSLIF